MKQYLKYLFVLAGSLLLAACAPGGGGSGESISSSSEITSSESGSDSSSSEDLPPVSFSLEVTGGKREFARKEEFSSEGIIVKLIGENTERILSSDEYIVDSSKYKANIQGEYVITVKYKQDERVKTTYTVTVSQVEYTITFIDHNNHVINSTVYSQGTDILFPTDWVPAGYDIEGWKLNNEGEYVTDAKATANSKYYAYLTGVSKRVTFTGLGVDKVLQTTYGVGLSEDVPTPDIDIYNTSYSTGGDHIDYPNLLEDATVAYSFVGNDNASYDEDTEVYTLNHFGYTSTYRTNGTFAVSADFTAALGGEPLKYTNSKLGFYLVDNNGAWLGIDLFGNEVINFVEYNSVGEQGYNSDGQGLFGNLAPVYDEDNHTFNFKLVYDATTNCFWFIFNENTVNEQSRFVYVDKINEFTGKNYDFSTSKVGLFNHSWGVDGSTATNISIDKNETSVLDSLDQFALSNSVLKDEDLVYSETYYSSSSIKATASFDDQSGKPGVVIKDANNQTLRILSWGTDSEFYIYAGEKNASPSASNYVMFKGHGTVQDVNHKEIELEVTYDYNKEVFYIKSSSYKVDEEYTNINGFEISISDLNNALAKSYDFSKYKLGLFAHSWSGESTSNHEINFSNILITNKVSDVNSRVDEAKELHYLDKNATYNEGTYTLTGNGYAYLGGASSSIYLKTKLNITDASQGITIYTNKGEENAQIMFQHKGYRIYKNYDDTPAVGDNGYEYNGDTDEARVAMFNFETSTNGEHIVEYFIINGNLHISYDNTPYFDTYLDLSLIDSTNFTDDAIYHIGLYNLGQSYSSTETVLEADVIDYAFGEKAYSKYTGGDKVRVDYSDPNISLEDENGNPIASVSYVEKESEITSTITAEQNVNSNLLINGRYVGSSATNGNANRDIIVGEENISLSTKNESLSNKNYFESYESDLCEPDQSIIYENGVYYRIYSNYPNPYWMIKTSTDLKDWSEPYIAFDFSNVTATDYLQIKDYERFWAPDLIKYNGKYYIVGNIPSKDVSGNYYSGFHMALIILRADEVLGNYELISKQCTTGSANNSSTWINVNLNYGNSLGYITPKYQNCIDGTIYIENGIPYLLYSDEHTNYSDGIGSYVYAQLSTDLSQIVSKPQRLFRPASDFNKPIQKTTDAVYLYKTSSGELLALYSTFDGPSQSNRQYVVHYARSSNGSITGTWSYVGHIYDNRYEGYYLYDEWDDIVPHHKAEGGHASIVKTVDGQLYLALHLNQQESTSFTDTRRLAYIAIKEVGDSLVWGLNDETALIQDLSGNHYTLLTAGNVKNANISFDVAVDTSIKGGLSLRFADGSLEHIHVGNDGGIYLANNKVRTIAQSKRYHFTFTYNKLDMTGFSVTVNGTNITSNVLNAIDFNSKTIIEMALASVNLNGTNVGRAAFFNVATSTEGFGNPVSVVQFSNSYGGGASLFGSSVDIYGNGYAYFDGASKDVYLKTKINTTYDHQGITIQVGDQNAQIGFQHKGYSVLENYGWDVPDKLDGNAFKYNNLLGTETANHGEHVVEYFIHEGKLYVVYDGNNLVPYIQLTLSEINDAFTADAEYEIGIYNFDNSATFNANAIALEFDDAALNEYNARS